MFEILTYPNQDELLNNRSELVLNVILIGNHINKYLLSTYKAILLIEIPFNTFRVIAQYSYWSPGRS